MKDNIVIVGAGVNSKIDQLSINISEALQYIDVNSEKLGLPLNELPPIPYVNHYLPEIHNQGKQFICKGKHQYREVKGKWICQCGRML